MRIHCAPPEHERLAVSALSDRLPFDIVDIIKIIFHRVVGFEGLHTYLRISGQTSTLSTPQRGARLNIQQWFRRYLSPLLPLGELRRGKHYFRYIAVIHQRTTAVTVLVPAGCPIQDYVQ